MNTLSRVPRIIKETNSGFCFCDLQDEMLQNREIECVGEICPEAVYCLSRQLRYLQCQDPKAEIVMYINSPGGEVDSGLALYDVMKAVTCPIRTICLGTAASMGALLFASGDQRDILPHGKVMIHDPLISGGLGGSALRIQAVSNNLLKTREILCHILAEHTKKSPEEIYEKTATDSYFYAEEAVAFGLADRIITEI